MCVQCFVIRISLKGFHIKCVTCLTGKRKTVTAAEMKEFEAQAECLGWSKPQVFNTDHGEKGKKCIVRVHESIYEW